MRYQHIIFRYPGVVSEMNTNVDITENFINYPNPYAANFDKNNVYFDEASVKIYDKKNRKNRKDMAIKDREFIKTENVKQKENCPIFPIKENTLSLLSNSVST